MIEADPNGGPHPSLDGELAARSSYRAAGPVHAGNPNDLGPMDRIGGERRPISIDGCAPCRGTLSLNADGDQRASGISDGQAQRRPRPRIETLADLIFGLSLSIGSLALLVSPPVSRDEINRHIVAFGFTFVILITAWLIYTTYMSVLPIETKAVTLLNVVLLLLVAVIPYLFNTVEAVNPTLTPEEALRVSDYSSTLFTLDLSGILLILAAFAHVISIEEKGLVAPGVVRLFRNGRTDW